MSTADMFKEGAAFAASFSAELLEACKACIDLENEISVIEHELSDRKKALNILRTKTLPDAMTEAGMSTITLDDGTTFNLGEYVSGSLPKEPSKREAALSWLTEHGGEGLIKTSVTAKFDAKQHSAAIAFYEENKQKVAGQLFIEKGVHSASLQAFVRELLRAGAEIPMETLGISAGPLVRIKQAKEG